MLIAMQVSVFASNGTVVVTGNGSSDSGTVQIPTLNQSTTTTTVTTTIPSVQTISTPTPTPTPTASSQNSTYTQNNLPKTGIDYTALFVIAACVISGVYAFIKVRDYNQIKY